MIIVSFSFSSPFVKYWNYAFVALSSHAKEGGHGHVEMLTRRITPAAVVVGRAEVGGGDSDSGAVETPLGVEPVVAHDQVAGAAGLALSKQRATHCCCVDSKPSMDCVIISASSSYKITITIYFGLYSKEKKKPIINLNSPRVEGL